MKKIILSLLLLFPLLLLNCSSDILSESSKKDYSNIVELNLPKDKINIFINGNNLELKSPIYLNQNRYFLCLNEIVDKLNGSFKKNDDKLNINILDINFTINTKENKFTDNNNNDFNLKSKLISADTYYYIDFSDLSNILNMYTHWDKDTKSIFCKTNDIDLNEITPYKSSIDTLGFLRIEDVELTNTTYDKDFFEKLRIMANYLSKKNVPFHIAWIPRYVNPEANVDNNPLVINDFSNAEQVYSLDYCLNHNGLIGLHGYTHQVGKEESAVGSEFGKFAPSIEGFKDKMEKAIRTASYLNIPITFFEAPHYVISKEQTIEAEKLFKILYYPYSFDGKNKLISSKPQLSPNNGSSYYIDTPLDYISLDDIESSLNNIKNADTKKMGSIFYHPRLEFKYISLSMEDNIPSYEYKSGSILERMINSLEEKGFKMSKVADIG